MGYTLYTDKDTNFECKVELKGASLKNAEARLVVEADDLMLMFKGTILKGGKCVIPVTKLNRFMDENTSGEVRLEIIAEDTYFQPWKSTFKMDAARKLTVEVTNPTPEQRKPRATVKFVNDPMSKLSRSIIRELGARGITLDNIKKRRPAVVRCINEQIEKSGMNVDASSVIASVVTNMAKRRI